MQILRVGVTATLGIVLLASTVQAWFFGPVKAWQRLVMLVGAVCMIYGGIYSDVAGLAIGALMFLMQRGRHGGGDKAATAG